MINLLPTLLCTKYLVITNTIIQKDIAEYKIRMKIHVRSVCALFVSTTAFLNVVQNTLLIIMRRRIQNYLLHADTVINLTFNRKIIQSEFLPI